MLARATSFIGITNRNFSGYRKRKILNTIVRAAAAAAVSSGASAFLLAHNHNPCTTFHSFGINAPIDTSSANRSYRGSTLTPATAGPSIGSKRPRRMFSSSLSESGQEQSQTQTNHASFCYNSGRPLKNLCLATLQACEAVTPAVEALYRSISNDNDGKKTTKTKADDSVFTIADGLVQYLLSEILLGQQAVGDIVGEEDCDVNLTKKPYTVDDFVVPAEFEGVIEQAIQGVTKARDGLLLSKQQKQPDNNISNSRYYQSLTAFIDPIDGTREFSTQKGEQCSICVGFADIETGKPVAGVVYRPLSDPHPTWAAGAKAEAYVASSLLLPVDVDKTTVDEAAPPRPEGSLLTSNGGISPFLDSLMKELDYERVPSGGAGNKILMLLEGKGTAYIQDRGVSRWDTCGAQAVLEAHGGILCKLDRFLELEGDLVCSGEEDDDDESSIFYTYRKTEQNLDFVPGNARLTKYNAAEGIDAGTTNNDGMAMIPSDVKLYANLCGLVALGKPNNNEKSRAIILDGLKRAAEISSPAFD
jgi:3'-phosphoadenosine 5'-phosphosulfate (PAPS) 3'-phosphatase